MADLTQFDFPSAVRIARVVRGVEQEPRRARPLTFGAVPADGRKVFRMATFTGDWDKNSSKTVTFKNQTTTPNTVSASNLLFDVAGPATSGASTTKVCIVGKEGTAWYFVNAEKGRCDNGSYVARELSDNATDGSNAAEILEMDGPQVLVNDQGCVTWARLFRVKLVRELELADGKLEWIEQELFAFKAGDGIPKEIETTECPAEPPA